MVQRYTGVHAVQEVRCKLGHAADDVLVPYALGVREDRDICHLDGGQEEDTLEEVRRFGDSDDVDNVAAQGQNQC